MNIKEKLTILRGYLSISRDYEYKAVLKDHMHDSNIRVYRLNYVLYHRLDEQNGLCRSNIDLVKISFKPFILPQNMNEAELFKVLSYLKDLIKNSNNNLLHVAQILDKSLDMNSLGFTREENNLFNGDITELFIVDGRLLLFKNSEFYSKYFNWYIEDVSLDDIKKIYEKTGNEFVDLDIASYKYKK